MHARHMGAAAADRHETLHAADMGRQHRDPPEPPVDLGCEEIERGIVASRDVDPLDPPGTLEALIEPPVYVPLRKQPLSRHLGAWDAATLDQRVDLLLVDTQVTSHLFDRHEPIGHLDHPNPVYRR